MNFELVLVSFPAGMESPKSLERFLSESTEALHSRDGQNRYKAQYLGGTLQQWAVLDLLMAIIKNYCFFERPSLMMTQSVLPPV